MGRLKEASLRKASVFFLTLRRNEGRAGKGRKKEEPRSLLQEQGEGNPGVRKG